MAVGLLSQPRMRLPLFSRARVLEGLREGVFFFKVFGGGENGRKREKIRKTID
jgi:hypothetical protein